MAPIEDSGSPSIAEQIICLLEAYLGPHTARVAVNSFAKRWLKRSADQLRREDVPALLDVLRPMLRTLVGKDSAEVLLRTIERDVG